jgi:hypothetical protein
MARVSFERRYVKHDGKLYPPKAVLEVREEELAALLELGATLVRETKEPAKRKRRGAKS